MKKCKFVSDFVSWQEGEITKLNDVTAEQWSKQGHLVILEAESK